MVFQLNDFTDSESENDNEVDQHRPSSGRNGAARSNSQAARGGGRGTSRDITPHSPTTAAISPRAGVSPRSYTHGPSASTSSAHPLRITLRPNLSHLTDPSPRALPAADRSSLSPPPPITLKLSRQARAEKATYSSSEGEDSRPDPAEEGLGDMEIEDEVEMDGSGAYGSHSKPGLKKKGAKRAKLGHGSSKTGNSSPIPLPGPGASTTPTIPPGGPTIKLPGQHRKTYDWLTPSSVSASHSGPPQRDDKGNVIPLSMEPTIPKKSAKRKSEPGSGPGRNWRKGLKKGAKPEYPDHLQDTSPYEAQSMSLEASPEPQEYAPRPELLQRAYSSNRGNTPPFEPADPVKLGFPVYTKPITNPKFTLGAFPRITQFFAPQNGGDTGPFPRREPVRSWKNQEMTLVGIGGGTLRYKSWHRGPATELTRLVQMDREARDTQRATKKANTAAASASTAANISASTTPAPSGPDMLLPSWDQPPSRPQLDSANSTDSIIPQLQSTQGDDEVSDVGDGEESVVLQSSTAISAALGPKGGKKKPAQRPSRAKPRKSKLAQEIMPVETTEQGVDL